LRPEQKEDIRKKQSAVEESQGNGGAHTGKTTDLGGLVALGGEEKKRKRSCIAPSEGWEGGNEKPG